MKRVNNNTEANTRTGISEKFDGFARKVVINRSTQVKIKTIMRSVSTSESDRLDNFANILFDENLSLSRN